MTTSPGRTGFRYVDAHGEHVVDGEMLMGNPDAVILVASAVRLKNQ